MVLIFVPCLAFLASAMVGLHVRILFFFPTDTRLCHNPRLAMLVQGTIKLDDRLTRRFSEYTLT